MSAAKRVTVRSNWGYFDELDGRDLKEGERLRLHWPDGTTTNAAVTLVKTREPGSDMGHPIEIPHHQAFVVVKHRGAETYVWLRSTGVLCERTE